MSTSRYWASVAAVGALLAGAGFAAGSLYGAGGGFREVAGEACTKITDGGIGQEVDALSPEAGSFSVHQEVLRRPGHYLGHCTVDADDASVLALSVEFTGLTDFDAWSDEAVGDWIPSEGRTKLAVGHGGWSAPQVAGVFLPCTIPDDNEAGESPGGLSVRVITHTEGDHRSQLAAIAERVVEEIDSPSGPCRTPGSST